MNMHVKIMSFFVIGLATFLMYPMEYSQEQAMTANIADLYTFEKNPDVHQLFLTLGLSSDSEDDILEMVHHMITMKSAILRCIRGCYKLNAILTEQGVEEWIKADVELKKYFPTLPEIALSPIETWLKKTINHELGRVSRLLSIKDREEVDESAVLTIDVSQEV